METRSTTLKRTALQVALIAVMAALIEAGKSALMMIPNVEVVTLFIALFGYVFGWLGMMATLIFVGVEVLIWGYGWWVVCYLIHWPFVCLVYWFLGKKEVKNPIILTIVAIVVTALFGISSSFVSILLYSETLNNFWPRLWSYYIGGIVYYLIEIGTNAIVFPLLFPRLRHLLVIFARRYGLWYSPKEKDVPKEPDDLPYEDVYPPIQEGAGALALGSGGPSVGEDDRADDQHGS